MDGAAHDDGWTAAYHGGPRTSDDARTTATDEATALLTPIPPPSASALPEDLVCLLPATTNERRSFVYLAASALDIC
jgi:hypothetical protein